MSAPSDSVSASPPALRRHRSFVLYWCARTATNGAYMMQAVVVGWQIYDLTGSALDLGLVGLVQFIPYVPLALVVGQIADRYDRRVVVAIAQMVKALAAAVLAFGSIGGWLTRDAFLAILFVFGTARAFEIPTMHALVPGLVPAPLLPRAIAASSTATQTAIIAGPALGGVLYAFGPQTVYIICSLTFIAAAVVIGLVQLTQPRLKKQPVTLETLFAGFAYLRHQPVLLGAMSIDLFALLLGSVTALLPIVARDILHTGPWGLGLLRSAPAIGALAVSIVLANHALRRRIGAILFCAMVAFSLSIIAFALSTSLILSIVALSCYGACDAISVVIRHSLVQTWTPNEMLGRVMAINSMFTGTSGTLGEFRAGAVAAGFGAFTAVLAGGIGAMLIVLLLMRLFPQLLRVDTFEAQRR